MSGGISAVRPGRSARRDPERGLARRRQRRRGHAVHAGERRRVALERGGERVERPRLALRLDEDALAVVEDEPGEPEAAREAVDEGAEADTLDDSGHAVPAALHCA